MVTTDPTPAEVRLRACVDEYGLLGVAKVLRDLYGSARLTEVLHIAERPSDNTDATPVDRCVWAGPMTRVDLAASLTVADQQAVATHYRTTVGGQAHGIVEMLVDLAHDALRAIPGVSAVTPVGGERPVPDEALS